MESKPQIIFLGTPEFAIPALEKLLQNNFTPTLVITQPDKPIGRHQQLAMPPVKELALANNLEVAQPRDKKELKEVFQKYKPDICILVAYGMIIPNSIINQPKYGFLNLHPSLLPKYRGPSPMQTAILNGDKKTGVSIIKLNNEVDAGDIVFQKEYKLNQTETADILHDDLAKMGAEMIVEILPDYLENNIEVQRQNHELATFTNIIKRSDGRIDWLKSAIQIERQFRAFFPWPGIFSQIDKKRFKIVNLGLLKGGFEPDLTPGQVFLTPNQGLGIKCGKGAVELKEVQIEGKNKTTGKDFINGQKDVLGKILDS